MKKLIFTILILIIAISIKAQINYYTVEPGQYVIYEVGAGDSITVDRKDTRGGVIAYRNPITIVDTIFKVPASASIDTVTNFSRPTGKKAAILFERGATYNGTITVADDSLYFMAYGSGAKPIISGFTTISGWTNEGGGIYSKVITAETDTNIVTINGVKTPVGRYPNNGYLDYNTWTGDSIIDLCELITNNTFSTTTGWTLGGTSNITGGVLNLLSSGASAAITPLYVFKDTAYTVTYEVKGFTGTPTLYLSGTGFFGSKVIPSTVGVHTVEYPCTNSTLPFKFALVGTATIAIDNVYLKEKYCEAEYNWTDADLVFRPNLTDVVFGDITSQIGATIKYSTPDTFTTVTNDYGFFIRNDIQTLDVLGEWAYRGDTLFMYFGANDPTDYEVEFLTDVIDNSSDYENITFKNIEFDGISGIYDNGINASNCEFIAANPAIKYYIDENGNNSSNGSAASPWATLKHATDNVVNPSDTIFVNAGNYTETANCDVAIGVNIKGEGATSNIVFTRASVNYTDASIRLSSAVPATNGNQSISHLYLDGNDTTAYHAIYVKRRSNVHIHDLTIKDFKYSAVTFNGKSSAITSYATPPVAYSTGNKLYNTNIYNCSNMMRELEGGGYNPLINVHQVGAINISGQEGLEIYNDTLIQLFTPRYNGDLIAGIEGFNRGVKIYDNYFQKVEDNGNDWNFHVELWTSTGGMEVYNNKFIGGDTGIDAGGYFNSKGNYDFSWDIKDNYFERSVLLPYPTHSSYAIVSESATTHFNVYRNYVKNFGAGISIQTYHVDSASTNFRIYSNMFENLGYTNNNSGFGVSLGTTYPEPSYIDSIFIYNNTFIANTGIFPPNAALTFPNKGRVGNVNFQNNIVTGFYRGPISLISTFFTGVIDTLRATNNVYYLNGNSNDIYLNGRTVTNYVNADNQITDPLFVETGTYPFSLQTGSPAIDAGIDVGLTGDILGNSVPSGAGVDIGAFEKQE